MKGDEQALKGVGRRKLDQLSLRTKWSAKSGPEILTWLNQCKMLWSTSSGCLARARFSADGVTYVDACSPGSGVGALAVAP